MKRILALAIVSLFVIYLWYSTNSFEQNIDVSSPKTGFNGMVDSIVTNKMNQYNIPGLSIGLVRNDSIIYANGYGVRKIGSDSLVSANSIFHAASISKLFTAMAIMQLVDNNVLALNDKLVEILPNLNFSDERIKGITIKSLLNHTSGLPDINNYHWENHNRSDSSLGKYIQGLNLKVSSEPSSEYHYSSLGYDILGRVVEKKSGVTFDDYVKENILNRSRMYDSDFRYFKIADSLKTYPHSKRWITRTIYTKKIYPYTREHSPSSTLNSSAKDLSKWMISFLDIINDKDPNSIYNSMLEPSFNSYSDIGLGFQLYNFEGYKAAGHFGGDKGFRSFLTMIPSENIGLVILGNCDYDEDYRQEIILPIAKLMLTKNKRH